MEIKGFWDAVLRQDADAIREYFHPDAWVNWHNTNEHFTVEDFIRANCEYPGEWDGEVEQIITTDMPIVIGDPNYRGNKIGRKVVSALVQRGIALGYDRDRRNL